MRAPVVSAGAPGCLCFYGEAQLAAVQCENARDTAANSLTVRPYRARDVRRRLVAYLGERVQYVIDQRNVVGEWPGSALKLKHTENITLFLRCIKLYCYIFKF